MRIYSSKPDGNESADLEPARYFNLALTQIKEISEWMTTADEGAQPLLVHLDMFLHISTKYPDMAERRLRNLEIARVREVFFDWYERCQKKIPSQFRSEIKESATEIFDRLEKVANGG
jgi:hypothetical protein